MYVITSMFITKFRIVKIFNNILSKFVIQNEAI